MGVRERVKSILNYKKPAFWIVAGAILTCIIIAVCFLTTSPETDRTKDDNSIYEEDATGLEDNDTEFEPYEKAENSTGNVENHSEGTSESVTEEINVEKYDITHDGIPDYIVTSMQYNPADMETGFTQQERIMQQIMYDVICVNVYEGKENSNEYSENDLLWSHEYSRVHVGNGQLSIVRIDGNDYLLTSSLYVGQGIATWDYEVFSLDRNGESNVLDKQSVEFAIEDSAESYKELQTSLNRYIENGILIVACDIDFEEQLIRTQENPYIPQNYYDNAFTKFDKQENEVQKNPLTVTTEFTEQVNTLEGVKMLMEKYKSTEGDLEIVNNSGMELDTGSAVDIQMEVNGKWYRVDQLYDAIWTDEAYIIPDGETTILTTRWSFMYGELPAGSYRIVKKVMDYRAPGDYDTCYLATEFEIRGE